MEELLLINIGQLVQPHPEAGATLTPVDVTSQAALWIRKGHIAAAGPRKQVEKAAQEARAAPQVISLEGRAVVPGGVDSHTHLVFAGDRVDEMARRARGETYEAIAAAGGGIVRSVEALREASVEELVQLGTHRLQAMLRLGTTTCEIKTGYGLAPELELKQLDAIERLATATPMSVYGTILAHVIPPAARNNRAAFVERFCREVIEPAAQREVVRFIDVFVERGAYTDDEARQLVRYACARGLRPKLHVDQLHEGGGAALAAELGALSADHLEQTTAEGRAALAHADTIATILPGCALFLGQDPWPRGRELRDAGCQVAVATDYNPGSSHLKDLILCGAMSATRCGLSLEEAMWGITRGGALAMGLTDRGTLRPGERADFLVLDAHDWRLLFYELGSAPIAEVWVAGQKLA